MTVTLPDWFGPLNRDLRYQLTIIGASFAQAIVSREIRDGGRQFDIKADRPNVKVSWQVTGIRKDAYANAHRIKVVEKKRRGRQPLPAPGAPRTSDDAPALVSTCRSRPCTRSCSDRCPRQESILRTR